MNQNEWVKLAEDVALEMSRLMDASERLSATPGTIDQRCASRVAATLKRRAAMTIRLVCATRLGEAITLMHSHGCTAEAACESILNPESKPIAFARFDAPLVSTGQGSSQVDRWESDFLSSGNSREDRKEASSRRFFNPWKWLTGLAFPSPTAPQAARLAENSEGRTAALGIVSKPIRAGGGK